MHPPPPNAIRLYSTIITEPEEVLYWDHVGHFHQSRMKEKRQQNAVYYTLDSISMCSALV